MLCVCLALIIDWFYDINAMGEKVLCVSVSVCAQEEKKAKPWSYLWPSCASCITGKKQKLTVKHIIFMTC